MSWLALALTSCAYRLTLPGQYLAPPLIERTLRVRPAYPAALTYRYCLKYKGKKCKAWQTDHYDVGNWIIREKLRTLGFICHMAGKRYKLCKEKNGYCHRVFKKDWMGRRMLLREDFVSVELHELLLDGKMKCLATYK